MRASGICSLLVALGACGGAGGAQTKDLGPLPAPMTRATLAGPLCEGESCRCRGAGDDLGAPPSTNVKRYEVRIGPIDNELWVQVDDMVLYKGPERPTECFYVDLHAGDHEVTVAGAGDHGLAARVAISELAPSGPWWYSTFEFRCGGPGLCDFDQLDSWKASLEKYKRGIYDPCGSTRVSGLQWKTGKAPDRRHMQGLRVELTLQVQKFLPSHPSGHSECADNI